MADRAGSPAGAAARGSRATGSGKASGAGLGHLGWGGRVEAELAAIRSADRWRQPRDLDPTGPVTGTVDGRSVVSFASNDYLGLTHHPKVLAAAQTALDRYGAGSGASRLVVGSRLVHRELEAELARWKGTEDALLFPTGYAANLGVLTVFGGADVTVLSDELNHASIIDGCRLARAQVRVYRHRDIDHLQRLLAEAAGPVIIMTDTVFSMDGDAPDLDGLVALATEHGCLLILDEAHAVLGPQPPTKTSSGSAGSGVVGSAGSSGSAARSSDPAAGRNGSAEGPALLQVGTLSKTLGALGGFVAGPHRFVDLLRNAARSFIFTTAPTPADTAAALAAVEILTSAEGDVLVGRLRHHARRLNDRMGRPSESHLSPIVPVVLGEEATARAAAASLEQRGLLVPAIRPPTVPPGTSRLRVALSAAHEDGQVDQLLTALDEVVPGWDSQSVPYDRSPAHSGASGASGAGPDPDSGVRRADSGPSNSARMAG